MIKQQEILKITSRDGVRPQQIEKDYIIKEAANIDLSIPEDSKEVH